MLNASALHFGYCAGDVVRFQILQGRLWVDFRTEREATGWYPMKNGPGVGRLPRLDRDVRAHVHESQGKSHGFHASLQRSGHG